MKLKFSFIALWLAALLSNVQAETIVVEGQSGFNEKPVPVALSGFSGEAEEVIRFDLAVQGFSVTSPEAAHTSLAAAQMVMSPDARKIASTNITS